MKMRKFILLATLLSLTLVLVPFAVADETCSTVAICKEITCGDPTSGLLLYTYYEWVVEITIRNDNPYTITGVVLADRFGAEFGVTILEHWVGGSPGPEPTLSYSGASNKVHLKWEIGDIGPGQYATLILLVYTDTNPAGKQEFTSCGTYYINSGAVVKWLDDLGHQGSAETPSLEVSTLPA